MERRLQKLKGVTDTWLLAQKRMISHNLLMGFYDLREADLYSDAAESKQKTEKT